MKYFLIYTFARVGLFLACWAGLLGILALIFGTSGEVGIWSFVGGAVLSSVLSLKLLNGPRERFAESVQARAERATARFNEIKTTEDAE